MNIFKLWKRYRTKSNTRHRVNTSRCQQVYIHPCVINNIPHIIYPRGLSEYAPELFKQLTQYYRAQGYALKEDQRSRSIPSPRRHERRRWAPIVLFSASLFFESSAHADVEVDLHNGPAQQVELQLVSNHGVRQQIEQQMTAITNSQITAPSSLKSDIAIKLFEILQQHYQKQPHDPAYITADLRDMANYYSEFPEVISLLESLSNKKWTLTYDEYHWVTVANGNIFQVDKAVVHFNTRSAAQLRMNNGCVDNPICIASPADALLHELLHTHSMLVETRKFISQGGMSSVLYPYKHEYGIIEEERKLYASMSHKDDVQRPQRTDHVGRLVRAHCPTCIK